MKLPRDRGSSTVALERRAACMRECMDLISLERRRTMSSFVGTNPSKKPSRLVELMRGFSARHGGVGVGFRPQGSGQSRTVALIGSVPAGDVDALKAAVEAGADAIEIRITGDRDLPGLADVARKVRVPVGITLPARATGDAAVAAAEAKVDWIRLPIDAHISTMEWISRHEFSRCPLTWISTWRLG